MANTAQHRRPLEMEALEDRTVPSAMAMPATPLDLPSRQSMVEIFQLVQAPITAAPASLQPSPASVPAGGNHSIDKVWSVDSLQDREKGIAVPKEPHAPLSTKMKRRDAVDFINKQLPLEKAIERGASIEDIDYLNTLQKIHGNVDILSRCLDMSVYEL